jgi:heme-degrading monooxygenase HmoA
MIVRMWHGRVMTSDARAYRDFVNERAIPDYQSVPGNISVHILEREEGDVTHFVTMTFWDSLAAISGFAGDDVEVAKYYPEDKDFLLEFEPTPSRPPRGPREAGDAPPGHGLLLATVARSVVCDSCIGIVPRRAIAYSSLGREPASHG